MPQDVLPGHNARPAGGGLPRTRAPVGDEHRALFARDGVLVLEDLVDAAEVTRLTELLEPLYAGQINSGPQRMDFADYDGERSTIERTTMIMQPHDFVPALMETTYLDRALEAGRALLGGDMEVDMTMAMDKLPHTAAATPWHQDEAYWLPGIPDRRSLSVWLALDEATVDNGCIWFVPGSHAEPTRRHDWAGAHGQTQAARVSPDEGVPVPLRPGSCTFHHGNMLHAAGGNVTDRRRRALVVNVRSGAMIAWERERGYDHRSENARNDGEPEARLAHPGSRR